MIIIQKKLKEPLYWKDRNLYNVMQTDEFENKNRAHMQAIAQIFILHAYFLNDQSKFMHLYPNQINLFGDLKYCSNSFAKKKS